MERRVCFALKVSTYAIVTAICFYPIWVNDHEKDRGDGDGKDSGR